LLSSDRKRMRPSGSNLLIAPSMETNLQQQTHCKEVTKP
jgi:hypothetical protein